MGQFARTAARVAVAISSAAFSIGLGALPASAASVYCGDAIRADTTLTADLHCSGDGLLVLADATLNLGGHTISGDGSGTGVGFEDFNTGEQATVARVRNGRITGFGTGIFASVYRTLGIERLQVDHTGTALLVPEDQAVTVARSEFVDNQFGIGGGVFNAHILVRNSTLARNSTAATDTIFADLSVSASVIDSNGAVARCIQGHINFVDTRVTRNTGGISMFQCDPSSFIRTVFEHNGAVITAALMYFENGLTISGSRFANNSSAGADLADVAFAQITDNVFVGNAAAGLDIHCGPFCINGGTITGNRFVRSAADGLRIMDGTFTVSDNVALRNGNWGLYADPSATITGSGNIAADNGQPAQCSGIPCN